MLFSGIPFLYFFLPLVLILYYAAPKKLRNGVLFAVSVFFYAWGEQTKTIFLIISVLLGYVFGLLIEKTKTRGKALPRLFLVLSVVQNLSFLCYFKYADFFISNFNKITGLAVSSANKYFYTGILPEDIAIPLLNVALPIGISFYTFQMLSYTVDVYRGNVKAQKNFIDLGAYITFFPQLIAGPIVRYSDIESQLDIRVHSMEKFSSGIRRFVIGLAKKVLIANRLAEMCDFFRECPDKSVVFYWIYAAAYMLHIYFDFSGYSDMAIGLGRFFGFEFVENFNYPFISKSVTEFWRRWHMSLGTWFRDYVYIPMGGNRVPFMRHVLNILVVWMLTGMWHGASWNFIIWGLYFAVLLTLEKLFLLKFLKKAPVINRIYLIVAVAISFIIFSADAGIGNAVTEIRAMFGFGGLPFFSDATAYYASCYAVTLVAAIIGATPIPKIALSRLCNSKNGVGQRIVNVVELILVPAGLIVCTAYLVDGSFNPFLYFRF